LSLKWYGKQVKEEVRRKCARNLRDTCLFLEGHIKKSFGKSPSAPGEPPGVISGTLKRSITNEVEGLTGRVGTNVEYGKYLELGTEHIAPRPFLRPALESNRTKIKEMMCRP